MATRDRRWKTKLILMFTLAALIGAGISAVEEQASFAKRTALLEEFAGVNVCFECHDASQTASFHYPDKIMGIEEKKGLRRRICVDCHGPAGNNADRQMTDPEDIVWLEEEEYYHVSPSIVHAIHADKLEHKAMVCETCHLIKDNNPTLLGSYPVRPKPKSGQILVCQLCHLPSDPGNYLRIHILSGHQECITCHTGDLKDIHKRATSALGRIF